MKKLVDTFLHVILLPLRIKESRGQNSKRGDVGGGDDEREEGRWSEERRQMKQRRAESKTKGAKGSVRAKGCAIVSCRISLSPSEAGCWSGGGETGLVPVTHWPQVSIKLPEECGKQARAVTEIPEQRDRRVTTPRRRSAARAGAGNTWRWGRQKVGPYLCSALSPLRSCNRTPGSSARRRLSRGYCSGIEQCTARSSQVPLQHFHLSSVRGFFYYSVHKPESLQA